MQEHEIMEADSIQLIKTQHVQLYSSPKPMVFTIHDGVSEHFITAFPFQKSDCITPTIHDLRLLKFWAFITHKTGATHTSRRLIAHVSTALGETRDTMNIQNTLTWVTQLQRCQNAGCHDVHFKVMKREAGDANPDAILEYAEEIDRIGRGEPSETKESWYLGGPKVTVCGKMLIWLFFVLVAAGHSGAIMDKISKLSEQA